MKNFIAATLFSCFVYACALSSPSDEQVTEAQQEEIAPPETNSVCTVISRCTESDTCHINCGTTFNCDQVTHKCTSLTGPK